MSSADLTPAEPLPLGGYTARGGKLCELPGEPLSVRTAVFSDSKIRIAIVSADLLTIPESLFDEVRLRVGTRVQLFLSATHTHCAPDSQMLNRRMDFSLPGIAKFVPAQLEAYAARITESVQSALRAPKESLGTLPIRLGYRSLNRARRAMAYPDTRAMRVVDGPGAPILTHYAAHAVLYGPAHNRPDPDFPGRIRGPKGLFLPGAIGDMSPASQGENPRAQVDHFEKEFEGGAWAAESWPTGPLDSLTLPVRPGAIAPNPEFARLNRIPEAFADTLVRRFAPPDGVITIVRIGKLALVGVPGEPTAELGRRIRSIGLGLGFRAVLTVSHCNGWMGYILAPEDYDRGGYEASLAFHGREFGNLIVERAKEGLTALRDRGAALRADGSQR